MKRQNDFTENSKFVIYSLLPLFILQLWNVLFSLFFFFPRLKLKIRCFFYQPTRQWEKNRAKNINLWFCRSRGLRVFVFFALYRIIWPLVRGEWNSSGLESERLKAILLLSNSIWLLTGNKKNQEEKIEWKKRNNFSVDIFPVLKFSEESFSLHWKIKLNGKFYNLTPGRLK